MNIYVYIHIPYCYSKCPYCSFVSFQNKLNTKQDYLKAILLEIENFFENHKGFNIKTIYFGGGTPSLLKAEYIQQILDSLRQHKISKDCEVTFEVIPNNATTHYLGELKKIGINRISLGIQSFTQKKLNFLGRIHNAKQNLIALENASKFFENISIDLIYGFEEFSDLKNDLNITLNMPIKHLSAYILSIEKGTEFYKKNINLSEENIQKQYLYLVKFLKNYKFYQYEISNFSQIGFKSKHNLAYWDNQNYVGFGLGASSFVNGIRYKNTSSLTDYISKLFNNLSVITYTEELSKSKKIREAFVLKLRTNKGVNINRFNNLYKCDVKTLFEKELAKHYDFKTLKEINGKIKISNAKNLLLSNYILSDFI